MTCPLLLRGHGESHPGVTSHGEEGTVPASSSEDAEAGRSESKRRPREPKSVSIELSFMILTLCIMFGTSIALTRINAQLDK